MANQSASDESTYDFWDFVHCGRCRRPYRQYPGQPPSIPFWLTECCHVICNNHLNPDQSCSICGTAGAEMVPLQEDLEPPMGNWFQSLPHALDAIAYTMKFQQETMAQLVHFWRDKCAQQQNLIEKMKREIAKNRQTIDGLMLKGDHLVQYEDVGEPDDRGKRRKLDAHQHPGGSRSDASAHSVISSAGPDRLTLPSNHRQPDLLTSRPGQELRSDPETHTYASNRSTHRPGSSRFIEQYAYNPPQTPRYRAPALSHMQTSARQRFQPLDRRPVSAVTEGYGSHSDPPAQTTISRRPQPVHDVRGVDKRQSWQMPPPPPPQRPKLAANSSTQSRHAAMDSRSISMTTPRPLSTRSGPFETAAPTSNSFVPSTPSVKSSVPGPRQLPTPSGPQRFVVPASMHSGQRVPFRSKS